MGEALVKSAARALEILELFASERRRLTLAQIGAILDYPKSSLSVLLKSLSAQGYLSWHPNDLTYFPTAKVTVLGDWLAEILIGEKLIPLLEVLSNATNETVTLTGPAGQKMRCLHVLPGTQRISLQLEVGTTFPILGTAVGSAYLASLSEAAAADFFAKSLKSGHPKAAIESARHLVEETRMSGYSRVYDGVVEHTGAIAMALPETVYGDALVIAVAGLHDRIHRAETDIVEIMKERLSLIRDGMD